jgi:Ca2+/H+ antiporter
MLVAGMGLVIPSIFFNSLKLSSEHSNEFLEERALRLSRVVAVVLLCAFLAYLWFQTRSHYGIYQDILQADETRHGRQSDKPVARLTLTEALLAVAIGVTFVSFMAVFLVQQIEVRNHKEIIPGSYREELTPSLTSTSSSTATSAKNSKASSSCQSSRKSPNTSQQCTKPTRTR